MSTAITFVGEVRWRSVKWWDGKATGYGKDHQASLPDRLALSVTSLRKAGFVARCQDIRNCYTDYRNEPYETILLRVEIYGNEDTLTRARHHMRGFWNALESKGLTSDYRQGFEHGVRVLANLPREQAGELPKAVDAKRLLSSTKRLKA